jgi:sporulation protein YlmC with PRC-barrel domain
VKKAVGEENLQQKMEKKVLEILNKNPSNRVPVGSWKFIDVPWETIKSIEKKGLIKICPFPQGKEIFIEKVRKDG